MNPEYAKRRIETEKGYAMVEFSHKFSSWAWECEWGHYAFDFEGEQEAREDFLKHSCDKRI